jgi:hypothetical protein
MITQEQAQGIATQIMSQMQDRSWELVEFDAGWLIRDSAASNPDMAGAAVRVIERESGRVVRFPSSVPPGRILREYAQVVERGRVESPA